MKKPGQHPLSYLNILLLCLGTGIFLASVQALPLLPLAAAGGFLLLLAAFLAFRDSAWAAFAGALLFFVLGAVRFAAADTLPPDDISHLAGQPLVLRGELREVISERPAPDGSGLLRRYVVAARQVETAAGTQPVSGALYVTERASASDASSTASRPRPGDTIIAEGTIRRLHGRQNPGAMDTVRQAKARGITARMTAARPGVRVTSSADGGLRRRLADVRDHYRQAMEAAMAKPDAAAVFAMLFGGYDGIRPELLASFTTTGIVHILSVSGSHITLLAAVMAAVTAALSLPRLVAAAATILAITGYVALAGFAAPPVRSGIMGILAYLAVSGAGERDARYLLSLTGLVMLLVSPLSLFDISFHLSFAATGGLLYLAPRLQVLDFWQGWPRLLRDSFAVTLAAQLSVLPILAWYFHIVSLSALLANLVVIPLVELVIVLGLAGGIAAAFVPLLGRLAFALDGLLLGLVYEMARLLAALPGSQLYLPTLPPAAAALYYALFALWLQPETFRAALQRFLLRHRRTVAGAAAVALLLPMAIFLRRPPEMTVHFIDVGQGDAALIVTPHGRAFMIDAGGSRDPAYDVGSRVDVPYLLHYGIRRLDYLFLTHAHEDHAGGAAGILRHLPVGQVITAGEGRTAYRTAWGFSAAEMDRTDIAEARAGTAIELDGVVIEILFAPAAEERHGNELSNVIRVRYGDISFLFTGDLVRDQETVLLTQADPASTVLKVAHHGSATSSSPDFLRAVRPRYAVISVGADNSFGHPAPETLSALRDAGAEIHRTDRQGAIRFTTDGRQVKVRPFAP
ncbi:MAG: DNA internalization-related competence protein ComEC/Rec2 [Schwartzia sp.]|nr:DNA internalization-related competence protein ComEC/Rec2 [Schwartzia sp. (in: firmicutes)]